MMLKLNILRARDIKKSYGNFIALKNINLDLKEGEIIGLIGENGAGKSTLLKILSGILDPDHGRIEYFGMDFFTSKERIKKKIGYLPETDSLYNNMTALDYLEFFASLYSVPNRKERAYDLLDMLKLPHDKIIEGFSKGMKRKLSIARTLIHDPDILIYDEPTGGLDPPTSLFISNLLRELRDSGKAILFSAHNMYYVESTCDKVIILRGGKILYNGDIENLLQFSTRYVVSYSDNSQNVKKKIIAENSEELDKILKEIREEGKIIDIVKEIPRLEDIYFQIMENS